MAQIKKISTEFQLLDKFLDTSGDAGTSGQVLSSTATGINWVSGSGLPGGPYLPLSAGSSYPLTGDLYLGAFNKISGVTGDNLVIGVDINNSSGASSFDIQMDGSTSAFYINNSRNVGIGTTSPGQKLEVIGRTKITQDGDALRINSSDANGSYATWQNNGSNIGYIGAGYHLWSSPNNIATSLGIRAQTRLDLGIQASVHMTILNTGNVGIGVTGPGEKLTIGDTGNVGMSITDGTHTQYVASIATANAYGNGSKVGQLYLRGYDGIGFSGNQGGATHMTLLTGGNVGIGTTNPRDTLEIEGNMRFVDVEDHLMIKPNNTIQGADFIVGDGVDATDTPVMSLDGLYGGKVTIQTTVGTSSLANKTAFDIQGTQGQLFSVTDDLSGSIFAVSDISGVPIFDVNSSGVSYFDGNVGIGTDSPFTNLEIEGSGLDSIIRLYTATGAANIRTWEMRAVGVAGEGLLFRQVNDANTVYTNRMILDNSGNVGIGTISPDAGIHALNSGLAAKFVSSQSTALEVQGGGNSQPIARFKNTAASDKVIISSTGSLGIGTTTPDTKLDVISGTNNGIRISATDTTSNWRDITIRSYVTQAEAAALTDHTHFFTTNPSGQSDPAFQRYGGTVIQCRDDGNSNFAIRIGNGNGHNTALNINASGVTTFNNTVTATNFILSSDERKKTKIKDLARNNVNVNWKSFELKEDEGEYRTGVIAQELEEKHPEFVNTNDEGFKSVKYIDLLIAKIAELEARLEKLEK